METGAFCEMYGITIENAVLEHLLESQHLGVAVGDMAKFIGISRPKAYEVMKKFEKKGIIKKLRVIGRTQLYILNKENKRVQLFLKHFKECLDLVVEEYAEDAPKTSHATRAKVVACAKSV